MIVSPPYELNPTDRSCARTRPEADRGGYTFLIRTDVIRMIVIVVVVLLVLYNIFILSFLLLLLLLLVVV